MFNFRCLCLLVIFLYLSPTDSLKCNLSIEPLISFIQRPKINREERFPDGFQTTKDLILDNGFGYEEYKVETEDGYILTTYRIIGKNSQGPPVLFRHGVAGVSDNWLLNGGRSNLAFQLADAGFDVWLSDRRGNWYSREHVKYKPNTRAFWNFGFQESGYYDLPAVFDQIIDATKYPQIFYIGHSMATAEIFVMTSLRPDYNAKVRLAVLFSPISKGKNLDEITSLPVKVLVLSSDILHVISRELYEVGARNKAVVESLMNCCSPSSIQSLCVSIFGSLFGENSKNVNKSTFATQMSHFPAGASLKTAIHLLQLFKTGFKQYNYGRDENLIRYNNTTPPSYPLDKVTIPLALYWSLNDPFINERSVNELAEELSNVVEIHRVEDPLFNHQDYLWGMNADKLVYQRVIKLLLRFR